MGNDNKLWKILQNRKKQKVTQNKHSSEADTQHTNNPVCYSENNERSAFGEFLCWS